ncbi:MAG: helix-turn-helix transcriptional regulator [Clostridia bacterium]|nr:helix-turn-helix transcriptional regulator [Clostridia bacterium]
MSIGQRISKLRKENNLSQEYIAEKLGVSRQAVSKWETDRSAPDTYNLISLAELFNVSVEYIAIGKQTENNQEKKTAETEKNDLPLQKNNLSTQRIIGLILLGVGLLSVVLGIVFLFVFEDDFTVSFLLFFLSFGLIIGGIFLIAFRKNTLAFATLVLLASILLILSLSIASVVIGVSFIIISIILFVAAFKIKKKKVD